MSLKDWFGKGPKGDWVDIGAPKKKGKFQACGRKSTKTSKRKYPKCVPRATVAKVKRVKKPYARKIQILTVMEQRAKVMGKNEVVRIAKQAKKVLKDGNQKIKAKNKKKKRIA